MRIYKYRKKYIKGRGDGYTPHYEYEKTNDVDFYLDEKDLSLIELIETMEESVIKLTFRSGVVKEISFLKLKSYYRYDNAKEIATELRDEILSQKDWRDYEESK